MAKERKVVEQQLETQEEVVNAPTGFVYPIYELWRTECTTISTGGSPTALEFLAVKVIRPEVKIEDSVAEYLNEQSRNSNERYYLKGTVKNGDIEKVNL